MAPARALALLSLAGSIAAADGLAVDVQCLVQQKVSTHESSGRTRRGSQPELSTDIADPFGYPEGVMDFLGSMNETFRKHAQDTVSQAFSNFMDLLDKVQTPFFDSVEQRVHPLREYRPLELLDIFTGFLVAYAHPLHHIQVGRTIAHIAGAVSTLASNLKSDEQRLHADSGGQVGVVKRALEDTVDWVYHHIAEAIGDYYYALRLVIDHPKSMFLLRVHLEYYPWLRSTAKYDFRKVLHEKVEPRLERDFWHGDWCSGLEKELSFLKDARRAIGKSVVVRSRLKYNNVVSNLARMRKKVPKITPFVNEVCSVKAPEALSDLNLFLNDLETSFKELESALGHLLRKVKQVAQDQVGCWAANATTDANSLRLK